MVQRFPISSHFCKHFLVSVLFFVCVFLNYSQPMGMEWSLSVVLIHISLMMDDFEHLFYVLVVYLLFAPEKRPFKSFAHFLTEVPRCC